MGKKESLAKERSKNRENEEVVVLASDFIQEPISRFTKKCNLDTDSAAVAAQLVRSELLSSKGRTYQEFETSILSKFNKNEISYFYRRHYNVGSIQFEKIRGRQNKEVELKRSVMTDMRRVGHLFMFFKKKFEAQCGM